MQKPSSKPCNHEQVAPSCGATTTITISKENFMKKNYKRISLDKENNITKANGNAHFPYYMLQQVFRLLVQVAYNLSDLSVFTTLLDGNNIGDIYALIVRKDGNVDVIFYDYDFLDYETGEQYDFEGINVYHTTVDDINIKGMISSSPYVLAAEDKEGKFKLITADMM